MYYICMKSFIAFSLHTRLAYFVMFGGDWWIIWFLLVYKIISCNPICLICFFKLKTYTSEYCKLMYVMLGTDSIYIYMNINRIYLRARYILVFYLSDHESILAASCYKTHLVLLRNVTCFKHVLSMNTFCQYNVPTHTGQKLIHIANKGNKTPALPHFPVLTKATDIDSTSYSTQHSPYISECIHITI